MAGGFKEFLLRGNVVDLAVGVVIGAAFGGVVTAFTKDLLTPMIAAHCHGLSVSARYESGKRLLPMLGDTQECGLRSGLWLKKYENLSYRISRPR